MKRRAGKKSLKAVIDTNVLVSGLFAESGTISELTELRADERFLLVTSEEILEELYRVLHKPAVQKHFKPTENEIIEFIELIREKAVITPNLYKTDIIKSDPADNKFLAAASEAKADFIVSGDKHLKDIREFHNTKIVDAKTFIEKVKKKGG
ncbi:MAG: putative toxin-antitoxin system toxin component, PIN family [Syntrophales bacterium]